ncbi:LytR/AlgR family response regulator transcription factor [Flavitalea flava]
MKISCIVIDDEPNALHLLEGYIGQMPSLLLKGVFYDAVDALAFLKNEPVDLIFTDINMPLLTGLELADILPGHQKIVFTTAFAEHALTSFSYHVIDFLLKPISFKRFIQAVQKAEILMPPQIDLPPNPEQQKAIVFAKSGKQIIKIDFTTVLFIKGEKEYVSIHFKNERLLIYKRMKDMEALLFPLQFRRVHASYIINTNYIQKVEAYQVLMSNAAQIPISKNYWDGFQQFLKEKII